MIELRKVTADEFFSAPNVDAVLGAYAQESSIVGLTRPRADKATYLKLAAANMFDAIGAFDGDDLLGFIVTLTTPLPHYSEKVASVESFFVLKEYRRLGLGAKLMSAAKVAATAKGAKGLLISAPIGSQLAAVLEKSKSFRETNRVFFTPLVPV